MANQTALENIKEQRRDIVRRQVGFLLFFGLFSFGLAGGFVCSVVTPALIFDPINHIYSDVELIGA